MAYKDFMAETIKNSGHSLRKLVQICKEKYNVKITASYLSKLQTGGQTPASDNVNIAVAKACGIDPEDMLFEASLERAPEDVKKLVDIMVNQIKGMYIELGQNELVKKFDTEHDLEKFLSMNTRQFIRKMLEEEDLLIDPLELNAPIQDKETDEKIGELFAKLSIGLKILDNSMFPLIQQGAKLELDSVETVKNGDIVSITILADNTTFIRTFAKSGDEITLIPANKSFETITIKEKDVIINGRVKSITIDL